MRKNLEAGEVDVSGLVILAVIIIILIIMPKDRPNSTSNSQKTAISSGSYRTYQGGLNAKGGAPESEYIAISSGNAPYSYQSYEEYIIIQNYGSASVDITNWQLKNGKDARAYTQGGSLQRFSADVATIPRATLSLSASGNNILQDVVLARGESAIITTGKVGVNHPYKIESFKENICSGYLEALPEYAFNPPLSRNCPLPAREPGLESLDTECRRYVERMPACRTPQFETRDSNGDICHNCVDKQPLSSVCVAFVKAHFSYPGCITYHRGEPDFSKRTWRVFLGRGWEMWAKDYESIELFNQFGQLVTSQSY